MPAHTAGRLGGSMFGSKKAASAAAHANDHRGSHSNHVIINHHTYHQTTPMILSASSTIAHAPFHPFATIPLVISDGAFITFFIAFHILGYVIWSQYNKD